MVLLTIQTNILQLYTCIYEANIKNVFYFQYIFQNYADIFIYFLYSEYTDEKYEWEIVEIMIARIIFASRQPFINIPKTIRDLSITSPSIQIMLIIFSETFGDFQ